MLPIAEEITQTISNQREENEPAKQCQFRISSAQHQRDDGGSYHAPKNPPVSPLNKVVEHCRQNDSRSVKICPKYLRREGQKILGRKDVSVMKENSPSDNQAQPG